MALDIRRASAWLKTRKLRPGARGVLHGLDVYSHWVLFFALEAVGVISIALHGANAIDQAALSFLKADVLFSQRPAADIDTPSIVVGPEWLKIVRRFRSAPLPPRTRRGSDPICIALSTGTTGRAKKVVLNRALLDRRIAHGPVIPFEGAHTAFRGTGTRLMSAVPHTTLGGLLLMLSTWMLGGVTCVRSTKTSWRDAFETMRVNVLAAAPIHLELLMAKLAEETVVPADLAILIGGGTLSEPLLERVRTRLTSSIFITYASTETGVVTHASVSEMAHRVEASGFVLPWMSVSVIDEGGAPTPMGQIGEVRVRGEDVAHGYLDDPQAAAKLWRDDWFYPGDVGFLSEDRVLTIVGRVDDLMNLGGFKLLPSAVEKAVARLAPMDDVAAFALKGPQADNPVMWIAYVSARDLDEKAVAALYPSLQIKLIRMEAIPRNAMGKIDREKLRNRVAAAA